MERERLQDYVGNGAEAEPTFSAAERRRGQRVVRTHMAEVRIDAALFASYHDVDFRRRPFGRRCGLVVNHERATTIGAGIDGGQPRRRTFGAAICTDWRKANDFHAVRRFGGGAERIGFELEHVTVDLLPLREAEFSGIEFVDIAEPASGLRAVQVRRGDAPMVELGGSACVEAVACPSTSWPCTPPRPWCARSRIGPPAELMDTWTRFRSGIDADGAHDPVTPRRTDRGDTLPLNCLPMAAGYSVALARAWRKAPATRTPGCGRATAASMTRARRCRRSARCSDIAGGLDESYAAENLLKNRSFAMLSYYHGREARPRPREDCETVLEPGMAVPTEPMIAIPEGKPGEDGYRGHDILVIEESGSRGVPGSPCGPERLVVNHKAETA